MKSTIVGVDLAKNLIQVCVFTNNKVHSNTEMTPNGFTDWLANSKQRGRENKGVVANYDNNKAICTTEYFNRRDR